MDANTITETRRYLKELCVKNINRLKIDMNRIADWPHVISFIKDFNVKEVEFFCTIPEDILRSSLQWNLSFLYYDRPINGEFLLEVDSSIPLIKFLSIDASSDVFMQILWKIQTGSLKKLSTAAYSVKWETFTNVPIDYEDPLPEDRPLLIGNVFMRWFLHWDGAVTTCSQKDVRFVEFSKCEKNDFPAIVQSKERVHKVLTEKSGEIRCIKIHFTSFFDGIPVLDASHEGPFPEERPLICGIDKFEGLEYYLLNEDGSIDGYSWCVWGGSAKYSGKYDLEQDWPEAEGHFPLLKFLLKKRIEKSVKNGSFECGNKEQFRLLFEDYEQLPHDFSGELPERRPLFFEGGSEEDEDDEDSDDEDSEFSDSDSEEEEQDDGTGEYRVVLYEDGSLTQFRYNHTVRIEPCPPWNLPSIMITLRDLKRIVLGAPLKEFTYNIDLVMFRDVFKGTYNLPFHTFEDSVSKRPFAFKKTELHDGRHTDQRWVVLKKGFVRKCEWKDGKATFSRGDPRDFPLALTKILVTQFFEGLDVDTYLGFYIDRFVLNLCLENHEVHDYDEEGLLEEERPLIFEKTEMKHTCQENPNGDCECEDVIWHFCFLSENQEVIHIKWEDRFMSFNKNPNPEDLPSILKTKETLEYLLEDVPWKAGEVHWYGSFEDLEGYFEDYEMIDFDYEGRLPKTRPLIFKRDFPSSPQLSFVIPTTYYFLRKDDLLLKCEERDSHVVIIINPKSGLPPAISSSS